MGAVLLPPHCLKWGYCGLMRLTDLSGVSKLCVRVCTCCPHLVVLECHMVSNPAWRENCRLRMVWCKQINVVLFILVISICAVAKPSDACSIQRWFGPECVYQCHCSSDFENYYGCSASDGLCLQGLCEKGYSGTSCQYENYAVAALRRDNLEVTNGSLSDTVDGNDQTCIEASSHPDATWSARLVTRSWVTQITLIVPKVSTGWRDVRVRCFDDADNTEIPVTPRQAQKNDTELVYLLREPSLVSRVQISAPQDSQLALCEVYILGGRNMAVKKPASQGEETYLSYTASRAVDGNADRVLSRSCSQTRGYTAWVRTALRSWWQVSLGSNLNIWRIEIHNTDGQYSELLRNFQLGVLLRNGSFENLYEDNSADDVPAIINVTLYRPVPATVVEIRLPTTGVSLTLCEVRIFGDCLDYFYGWKCEDQCNCENSLEVCDKVWGSCSVSGCKSGWRGSDCRQPCQTGTYGYQCGFNCSDNCARGGCHHVNGTCSKGCKLGWTSEKCDQECPVPYYGKRCQHKCAGGCFDNLCHHATGECTLGCYPGWQGTMCSKSCDVGFYGNNCSSTCNIGCVNSTCDATSGKCTYGCAERPEGDTCTSLDRSTDDSTENDASGIIIGVVVGLVFLILLLTTVAVIVWRRYRKRNAVAKPKWDKRMTSVTPIGLLMDSPDSINNIHQPLNRPNSEFTCKRSNSMSPAKPPRRRLTDKREAVEMEGIQSGTASSGDESPLRASRREKGNSVKLLGAGGTAEVEGEAPKDSSSASVRRPQLMALFSRDVSPPGQSLSATEPSRASRRAACSRQFASFESLDELSTSDTEAVHAAAQPVDNSDYYNVVFHDTSPNTVVSLAELPARVANWMAEPRIFNRERGLLPEGKIADWKAAVLPENIRKNRYREVYPYDHSRVHLTPVSDDPTSDYYNANYIDGYKQEKEYIAAQGPMEKTLEDFLRMVWDVNCPCIVMLTNTVEMGRFKCQQYWPAEDVSSITAGSITVSVTSVTVLADYCVRQLTLERCGQRRRVAMFHYTAWPDNFAPSSPWSLLDFRHRVRQAALTNGPTLVHCSAGIGRTGTYLALDIQLSRAGHDNSVDVFTCVWKLRQQRISMVQTLAQYIFIYEVLAAALMTSVPVPVKDFNLSPLLEDRDGKRLVEEEFNNLERCLSPPKEVKGAGDGPEKDVGGAADGMELPRDIHRVPVFSANGKFSSVFVNAVFQSSYRQNQAFIQAHSPQEGKVVDFLSMAFQHQVTAILCLDSSEGEHEVAYWPEAKGSCLKFDPYRVELLSRGQEDQIAVRALRIYLPGQYNLNSRKSMDPTKETWHDVTHITCSSSLLTSECMMTFLRLVNTVRPEPQRPVLVHCKDGHSKSGLFCVLYAVLERLQAEGTIAVSYVTAHMRSPRRQNVASLEQYEFLYRCVQRQLDVMQKQTSESEDVIPRANGASDENTYSNVGRRTDAAEEPVYGNAVAAVPFSIDRSQNEDSSGIYSNLTSL